MREQAITGRLTQQFLHERYWERPLFKLAPKFWQFRDKRCIDRNGVRRKSHDYDKDDRCVFCDHLMEV